MSLLPLISKIIEKLTNEQTSFLYLIMTFYTILNHMTTQQIHALRFCMIKF